MNDERKNRIQALAEAAFDAAERYNALAAARPAGSVEERRRAFVELNLAKADAVETKNALDKEVGSFADHAEQPRPGGGKPFEPLLNLNWLEDIFGGRRK